jgi:hypothetical protein
VVSRSSRPGAGLLDGFGGKIRRIRWKFPEDYQDPMAHYGPASDGCEKPSSRCGLKDA